MLRKKLVCCLAVLMGAAGWASPCLAALSIDVGTHVLAADTPNQSVVITIHGGDAVEGLNLYVQVADGGPAVGGTITGPSLTGVDILTGTIFDGNNLGAFDDAGNTAQVFATLTLTDSGTVSAEGKLATLTLDTTGFTSGTWTLMLANTVAGTSDFAGIPIDITNGSISINPVPEPTTLLIPASLGLLCLSRHRRA